ncbi:MAG: DUF5305 family protein [Euryarchaeota archaeon]|nr:DUF5305 family protein [Euryarchaeota archaeon]
MYPRLKLRVANNGLALAAVCVIAGLLLFAAAGHVYTTPEVQQQEPVEVDNYDIQFSLSERAVVENENPLYETGEVLESKPAYFTNATPEITFVTAVSGSDDRNVSITQRFVLVEEATRDGEQLWSRERVLQTNEETFTDGQSRTNLSLDIEDLASDQTGIRSALGGIATPTTNLRLETTYRTESVEGRSYQGQLSLSLRFESTDNAYWFAGSRSVSDSETRLERPDPVQQPPNYLHVFLLSLGGVGLIGLAGVTIQKSNEYDPHELRIEMYNAEYSEWISEGELVVDPDRQYVYVNSLGDLVDIGIDADKRVIHDRDLKAYVVVDNDLIYYFAREPTNIELWANVGGSVEGDQR